MSEPGGPERLQIAELPDPQPGVEEVLVHVAAAGVNRADLLQRQGQYPPPPGASEILGLECSGEVAALGPGVTGWTVGTPCVALLAGGGYAEKVAVPVGQVLPVPEGVDLVTAAGLVEAAATVWSNLDLARLVAGETMLVHGAAGGVGSFAVQYAKHLGATVVATAGSPEKLDYCRSIGADHALSYKNDWAAALTELTGRRGVDVILDVIGAKYLEQHVSLLAPDGRLVVIGLQGGRRATLDLGALLSRRAQIIATALRSRPRAQKAAICTAVAASVWPLLAAGAVRPAPQTRFSLASAADAHRRLESGENLGKIVLVIDQSV